MNAFVYILSKIVKIGIKRFKDSDNKYLVNTARHN